MLCGLCVRVCSEVVGVAGISFANRGQERRVDSPFSLGSEDCAGCCACAAICPTDAITAEYAGDTLRLEPFKTDVKVRRCLACGKPVAAIPLLDLVRAKTPLPLLAAHLCPECKAERRARALAAATASRRQAAAPAR
jgi:bidirectional [NiFe] hydrogenase diaphorase subunit